MAGAEQAITATGSDAGQGGGSFQPSVGTAASLLANVPAVTAIALSWLAYLRGDAEQMAGFAALAGTRLRDGDHLLSSIYRLNLALAYSLRGLFLDDAEYGFTARIARWRASGQQALAAQGHHYLGQIRHARGNLDTALDAYRELLQITTPACCSIPGRRDRHVGLAEVAYQRGDLTLARRELEAALPLCRQLSERQALASGLATLALDPAGRRLPGRGPGGDSRGRTLRSQPGRGLLNPVPAERARLALAQGDIPAAARWTRHQGLSADDELTYVRERDYLVLARVLVAQDQPGTALGLLGRLLAIARGQARTGSVIEITALQALALTACCARACRGRATDRGARPGQRAALRPCVRRRRRPDGRPARPGRRRRA